MYPDLSYILNAVFGTDVDNWASIVKTFGLFLALSFLVAAYTLYLELKRKAGQGLFQTMPMKDEKGVVRQVYPHDRVGDITMVAAISGLLGAKIFAILESVDNIMAFLRSPIANFFTGSGLAIYGGLIGGFVGVYWFITKKLNMKPIYMMDAVAPALILAYGVGRIGCQLSGDGDWGIASGPVPAGWFLPDWLWSFHYPHNVLNMGIAIEGYLGQYNRELPEGVFPTPVYETVMAFAIFGVLWLLRKRLKTPGLLFMIYLVLNGVERFFIEKIRVNDKLAGNYTQAEIIALLLIIIGVVGGIWLIKKTDTPYPPQ